MNVLASSELHHSLFRESVISSPRELDHFVILSEFLRSRRISDSNEQATPVPVPHPRSAPCHPPAKS